jgi:Flp pilus assembly protein TadB
MSQTKRKRKHRGTQAGTVEQRAHNTRSSSARPKPKTKDQIRTESRRKRMERFDQPPTMKGAVQRAGIAAAVFAVLVIVIFQEKPATAVALAAFMLLLYVPMSYATDKLLYNRRQRQKAKGGAR